LASSNKQKQSPLFRVYTVFNLDQTSLVGQGDAGVKAMPEKLQELLSILKINLSEFGNQPIPMVNGGVLSASLLKAHDLLK